ncbi:MAG TPA: hypothetical protein VFQ68_45735 [Streptosporangiaceae bacterium]|nr:hypothetical protein [Streptosporangiaceae bacterium]
MNPAETVAVLLVWVLAAMYAGSAIGTRKGRPAAGFALGLLLGWIGVAIIALTPPTRDVLVRRERERQQIQREAREGPAAPADERGTA